MENEDPRGMPRWWEVLGVMLIVLTATSAAALALIGLLNLIWNVTHR